MWLVVPTYTSGLLQSPPKSYPNIVVQVSHLMVLPRILSRIAKLCVFILCTLRYSIVQKTYPGIGDISMRRTTEITTNNAVWV